MSNEIVSFEEGVKRRMKDIIADMIPEDRWKKLVDDQIRMFEKEDLPRLIRNELTEAFKKKVAEELSKPEYNTSMWNNGMPVVSDAIKKMIIDAAPDILANMIGMQAQILLQNFRQSMAGRY